jgi:hypothetical protein
MKLYGNARTCPKSRRLLVERVESMAWSVTTAPLMDSGHLDLRTARAAWIRARGKEAVAPAGVVMRPVKLPPELAELGPTALAGQHERKHPALAIVRRADLVEAVMQADFLHKQ